MAYNQEDMAYLWSSFRVEQFMTTYPISNNKGIKIIIHPTDVKFLNAFLVSPWYLIFIDIFN